MSEPLNMGKVIWVTLQGFRLPVLHESLHLVGPQFADIPTCVRLKAGWYLETSNSSKDRKTAGFRSRSFVW